MYIYATVLYMYMSISLSPGHAIEDARHYGWELPQEVGHQWTEMVETVQNHIGALNWGYRTALRKKEVKYLNSLGEFVDPHTLKVGQCVCMCIIIHTFI